MIKPINGSFRLEGFETPAQAYERAREIEAAEDDLSLAEHDLESLKEILENAPPEREEKARQGIRRGWKRRKQETKRRYTRMYKVGQQVKAKKNVVKTDEWLTVLAVDKVEWDGEEMNELTVEEPTGRTMQVFEDFIIAKR